MSPQGDAFLGAWSRARARARARLQAVRIVVACTSCQQQFDASGWESGSRFRCYCGQVVSVVTPRTHHAAVVRCSACGAARAQDSASCDHCGAQFTLHERDLTAMCPRCLARISGQAKYCHHCGTTIHPNAIAAGTSELACPVCGDAHSRHPRTLSNRGHVGLECRRCTGLWLDHAVFDHFVGQAKERSVAGLGAAGQSRAGVSAQQAGPAYRKCVHCSAIMNRKNYGKRSNVVIDLCRLHGVWFDADELNRILTWVQVGGHERSSRHDAVHANLARKEQEIRGASPAATDGRGGVTLGIFVGGLAGLFE